jgi:hypothetical protein
MRDEPHLTTMVDVSDPFDGPVYTYSHNEGGRRINYAGLDQTMYIPQLGTSVHPGTFLRIYTNMQKQPRQSFIARYQCRGNLSNEIVIKDYPNVQDWENLPFVNDATSSNATTIPEIIETPFLRPIRLANYPFMELAFVFNPTILQDSNNFDVYGMRSVAVCNKRYIWDHRSKSQIVSANFKTFPCDYEGYQGNTEDFAKRVWTSICSIKWQIRTIHLWENDIAGPTVWTTLEPFEKGVWSYLILFCKGKVEVQDHIGKGRLDQCPAVHGTSPYVQKIGKSLVFINKDQQKEYKMLLGEQALGRVFGTNCSFKETDKSSTKLISPGIEFIYNDSCRLKIALTFAGSLPLKRHASGRKKVKVNPGNIVPPGGSTNICEPYGSYM